MQISIPLFLWPDNILYIISGGTKETSHSSSSLTHFFFPSQVPSITGKYVFLSCSLKAIFAQCRCPSFVLLHRRCQSTTSRKEDFGILSISRGMSTRHQTGSTILRSNLSRLYGKVHMTMVTKKSVKITWHGAWISKTLKPVTTKGPYSQWKLIMRCLPWTPFQKFRYVHM